MFPTLGPSKPGPKQRLHPGHRRPRSVPYDPCLVESRCSFRPADGGHGHGRPLISNGRQQVCDSDDELVNGFFKEQLRGLALYRSCSFIRGFGTEHGDHPWFSIQRYALIVNLYKKSFWHLVCYNLVDDRDLHELNHHETHIFLRSSGQGC